MVHKFGMVVLGVAVIGSCLAGLTMQAGPTAANSGTITIVNASEAIVDRRSDLVAGKLPAREPPVIDPRVDDVALSRSYPFIANPKVSCDANSCVATGVILSTDNEPLLSSFVGGGLSSTLEAAGYVVNDEMVVDFNRRGELQFALQFYPAGMELKAGAVAS